MIKKSAFLFTLIFLFLSSQSFAQNTYAATVSELDAAINQAQPGDTIFMKTGTWENAIISFDGTGTANNPIVLAAEVPGQVFLEGSSRLSIGGTYLVVSGLTFQNGNSGTKNVIEFRKSSSQLASYCRLTNCLIKDYSSGDDVNNKWISLYGDHNRVDHCTMENKTNLGSTLTIWYQSTSYPNPAPSTYHQVDHNYFHKRTLASSTNGGESLRVGTSQASRSDGFNIIEYNLFEECDGEIEIISNKTEFNTYRYNTFQNNNGGLTLRHGANCYVYGNFFFGGTKSGSYGIRVIDSSHYVFNNYLEGLNGGNIGSFRAPISLVNGRENSAASGYLQVTNTLVAHNTIVDCNGPSIRIGAITGSNSLVPTNCTVSNNLIYQSDGDAVTHQDEPINMTYAGNIYFDSPLGITSAGWTNIDPLMDNSSADQLWRLTANSPAIDAAVDSFLIDSIDVDGHYRAGIADVGADEYSTDSVLIKPLTSNDVGPCWMRNPDCEGTMVGLKNAVLPSFSIYPSPTKGEIKIEGAKIEQIEILTIDGKIIKTINRRGNSFFIDLRQEAEGFYLVRLIIDNQTFTRKIQLF